MIIQAESIDRELRAEIERRARIDMLKRLRDMCLRHASQWDHKYSNPGDAGPSQRFEWRGRAIESADIAETIRVLIRAYNKEGQDE